MKTIKIKTERGEVAVANWHQGKLAFWRKTQQGNLFSDYPSKECSLKAALAYVERCYNTPNERVSAAVADKGL